MRYIAFFVIPVSLLSAVDLLFRENLSLEKTSENAFLISQLGCFIFKLLPFINNADEMEANIYMIDSSIFLRYTKKQQETAGFSFHFSLLHFCLGFLNHFIIII
jgi:hypothetical protein